MTLPNAIPLESRLLRMADLEELTGLRRSRIADLIRDGSFPSPVRLAGEGGRAVAWRGSEVIEWISTRPRVTYPATDAEA